MISSVRCILIFINKYIPVILKVAIFVYFFGSLVWDCVSPQYAVLEELPRHVEFEKGDTVITSGYSAVFPEGLIVGTIEDKMPTNDDNFYTLKIKLTTDFSRLSTVRAIKNGMKEELDALEAADYNSKKGGRK